MAWDPERDVVFASDAEPPKESVEVEFISALDDAQIRLNCYQLIAQLYKDAREIDTGQVLGATMDLYEWVMGHDELQLEEAAEPASVTPGEKCEPRH